MRRNAHAANAKCAEVREGASVSAQGQRRRNGRRIRATGNASRWMSAGQD